MALRTARSVSRQSCLLAEAEVIPGRPMRAGPGTEHGLSGMHRKAKANVIEVGVHGFRARYRAPE